MVALPGEEIRERLDLAIRLGTPLNAECWFSHHLHKIRKN